MKEIKNYVWGVLSNTPLSDFQYTYNAVGTIATWQQQTDSNTPIVNTLSYDGADQLTGDVQSGGGSAYNNYAYDPAGNRLAETTASGTVNGQFNRLNQLVGYGSTATATTTVSGQTSAAVASATVNTLPATVTNSTNFTANVPLPPGTNIVSVVAQPPTGVPVTQRVTIVTTGTTPSALTYDANGNTLTDENGNTYTWDALNRLVQITYPSTAYTTFAYDGLSRRVQIVEYDSSTAHNLVSTKDYLWIGSEIAEERGSSNNVTKRFFPQGEQQSGTNYYYATDHLGSVREMLNSSGSIVARYAYDPYGVTTLVQGTNLATLQYAGMYMHQPSDLYFSDILPGVGGREYDPQVGWITRDPLGEGWDSTLYSYVYNNPVDLADPLGLAGGAGKGGGWFYPNHQPPPPINDGSQEVESEIAQDLIFTVLGGGVTKAGATAIADAIRLLRLAQQLNQPPKPPGWNDQWQWRCPESGGGGPRWFDPNGGEWRYHPADKWHNPHWDYNPWNQWNSPWQNVPIPPNPPLKTPPPPPTPPSPTP